MRNCGLFSLTITPINLGQTAMFLLVKLLLSHWHPTDSKKSYHRFFKDAWNWQFTMQLPPRQANAILPSTSHQYDDWARRNQFIRNIEDVGDVAKIMWLGKKRTDKVLLFIHGKTSSMSANIDLTF